MPELTLSREELHWVGERIFANECARRPSCLVSWNEGEAFPSLGIGHFIWYPEGVNGPFVESFPKLVAHLRAESVALPAWLQSRDPLTAPWPDRSTFLANQDDPRIASLRGLLLETQGQQAAFMFMRAQDSIRRILAAVPESQRENVRTRLQSLAATPAGTYALIDYVNFKGEGLAASESYQGQGWGLRQVILEMEVNDRIDALEAFRLSASRVLTRRAENASKAIEREKWLPGWLKRVASYRHGYDG